MSLNMRAARNILVLIAILALSATASATEHQAGTWVSFATSGKLGDSDSRWRYCFDVQARYVDIGSGANQYVGRPALGYALNDSVTARLGYARVETRSQSGLSAHENRYWQQNRSRNQELF